MLASPPSVISSFLPKIRGRGTPERHVFWTSCQKEVQQFMKNEVHDILYVEDCAPYSLNAAHAFSRIIHAGK